MAIQVHERVESRTLEFDGEVLSGRRVFRMLDNADGPVGTAFEMRQGLSHPDMPKVGDQHPEVKNLFLRKYRVNPRSGESSYVYDVTFEYEQLPRGPDPDDPDQASVDWTGNVEVQFLDCWRDVDLTEDLPDFYQIQGDGTFHYGGNATWTPDGTNGDIGGIKIDSGGEPVSCLHTIATWQIRRTYPGDSQFSAWLNIAGKRNSQGFWFAPVGKVLYRGFSFREVEDDNMEVTHQFAYDDWYHLRQVVWRDPVSRGPELGTDNLASNVRLYQPFPKTVSFAALGLPGGP